MLIEVGDVVPEHHFSVDAEAMKVVALLLRDPNPIHWDVAAVQKINMGSRPINQGPVNVAYVMNALIRWVGDPACIRKLQIRFLNNAFAGDVVVAGGRVTAVNDDVGNVRSAECALWLDRANDGVRLLRGTAMVRIDGRHQ